MKTYFIEVSEISSRTVSIEANTVAEAMEIANLLYKREEILLDSTDHNRTEIDIKSNDESEVYNEFLLQKALKTLSILSNEELAKLAFGSIANAQIQFEKRTK